jgi:hypothetical protein
MATHPERHASVTNPETWADYTTALAAVQAGRGDGVTYVLTKQENFAAIDMDHCRNAATGSVDIWAQLMLEQALHSYAEITPSGNGLRIWGTGTGEALHRKFNLDTGENAAVELFRATNKALTVSGLDLKHSNSFGNIDRLLDWSIFFGEKHKPVPKPTSAFNPIQFNSNGKSYSIDEYEAMARTVRACYRPGKTVATCFNRSSGITRAVVAGQSIRRSNTCSNFRMELASDI